MTIPKNNVSKPFQLTHKIGDIYRLFIVVLYALMPCTLHGVLLIFFPKAIIQVYSKDVWSSPNKTFNGLV